MMDYVYALISPGPSTQSLRQDRVPQDVLDVLAFAFSAGMLELPLYGSADAVEIRLDDPRRNLCLGGDGRFMAHAGSSGDHYFTHRYDEEWAEIHASDCTGDAALGEKICKRWATEEDAP